MERRIGTISIIISDSNSVVSVNSLLSEFAENILARQGLPLRDKGISIITIIIEATTDQINALTGKLGRIEGVSAKSFCASCK